MIIMLLIFLWEYGIVLVFIGILLPLSIVLLAHCITWAEVLFDTSLNITALPPRRGR